MTRRPAWALAAALALVVLLSVVCAALTAPVFWRRYLLSLGHATPPPAVLEPRARITGGNEPPAPRVAPALENLDPAALAQAGEYAGRQGSAALIVSRHSHIVFERYWQGTGFDTVADAQGLTPLVAALATGAAVSRRQLSFPDEPLSFVLTEWRDDPRGAITLRQLMQMSSGLSSPGPAWLPWTAGAAERYGTRIGTVIQASRLSAAPGERWLPQAADPQLLSQVLSRATGQSYAGLVSELLWRPLGAGDAWLWLDRPGGTAHADCCLRARQGDWIRVAELLLKDGNYRGAEIIRPGWIAEMVKPAPAHPAYGAYLRLEGPAAQGPGSPPSTYATPVWVAGDSPGGNRLWAVPSLGIAIVRIAAGTGGGWDDTVIPDLIIRGTRDFVPPRPRGGSDLQRLVPAH